MQHHRLIRAIQKQLKVVQDQFYEIRKKLDPHDYGKVWLCKGEIDELIKSLEKLKKYLKSCYDTLENTDNVTRDPILTLNGFIKYLSNIQPTQSWHNHFYEHLGWLDFFSLQIGRFISGVKGQMAYIVPLSTTKVMALDITGSSVLFDLPDHKSIKLHASGKISNASAARVCCEPGQNYYTVQYRLQLSLNYNGKQDARLVNKNKFVVKSKYSSYTPEYNFIYIEGEPCKSAKKISDRGIVLEHIPAAPAIKNRICKCGMSFYNLEYVHFCPYCTKCVAEGIFIYRTYTINNFSINISVQLSPYDNDGVEYPSWEYVRNEFLRIGLEKTNLNFDELV